MAISWLSGGASLVESGTDYFGGLWSNPEDDDPGLPTPLSISSVELGRIYDDRPGIASETLSYILSIGFCPESPDGLNAATCSEMQRSNERLAAQAIYLANGAPAHSRKGIGEGFGPEEQHVRELVEKAIASGPVADDPWSPELNWQSQTTSGSDFQVAGVGGGINPTTLLLVLGVAVGLFLMARELA